MSKKAPQKVNDIRSFFSQDSAAFTSPVSVPTRRSKKRPQTVESVNQDSDSSSDHEDPLPKHLRKQSEKKRKARVLSDEDEDFKDSPPPRPAAKVLKKDPPKEPKVKHEDVDVNAFFGKKKNRLPEPEARGSSTSRRESPRKKEKVDTSPVKVKPEESGKLGSPSKKSVKVDQGKKPESTASKKNSTVSNEKMSTPPRVKKESTKSTHHKQTHSPTKKESSKKNKVTKVVEESSEEEEEFNPKAKKSKSKPKEDKEKESKANSSPKKDPTTPIDPAKKIQQQNYSRFLAKASQKPKNLGRKDIPSGSPDCLQGLTFVISGVLDSLERDDCKNIIESYGGRVTGAVSRKTNYLIVGDDPGESKTKKAKDLGVGIIDEDKLLDMIRDSAHGRDKTHGNDDDNKKTSPKKKDISPTKNKRSLNKEKDDHNIKKPRHSEDVRSPDRGKDKTGKKSVTSSEKFKADMESTKSKTTAVAQASSSNKPSSSSPIKKSQDSVKPVSVPIPSQMFVDKYRPTTVKQVVGQSRDNSNLRKLIKWLQNWFKNQANLPEKKNAFFNRDPEGKSFKCALLSGPPGVGKTTCAHLAVKECGYDYFELNASDTRNKRGLVEHVRDALQSMTLSNQKLTSKHVLIMDEVDGMSGNEDRGGIQELIHLIKGSKIPLICICNDRNHQKIRSLANHCFDLRFNSPTIQELKGFLSSICFKEGIKLPAEKMNEICISSDQDVRMILNQLQMIKTPMVVAGADSQNMTQGMSSSQTPAYTPKRDMKYGPWDVCRMVFSNEGGIRERTGLFFQDYSFGPLFVQENYAKHHSMARNKFTKMKRLAQSAEAIATGDLIDNTIRRTQNWSLLPIQAVFSVCTPGHYMRSPQSGRIEFPSWLGRNSNKNKRSRLLQLLHTHLHLTVSGGQQDLNLDYLSFLRKNLCGKLHDGDTVGASQVMEKYSLARDDLDSIIDLTFYPGMKNPLDKIDSKTKSAFTRLVNKEMLPYSNSTLVKKSRGGGNTDGVMDLDEDDGGEGEVEEDSAEENDLEKDAMIKMKNKKTKASAKTTTSTSAKVKKEKSKKK